MQTSRVGKKIRVESNECVHIKIIKASEIVTWEQGYLMEGRINIIDITHWSTSFCLLQLNLPVQYHELVSVLGS